MPNVLDSPEAYQAFVYSLPERHSSIQRSRTAADYCKAHYPHKEKLYWYDSFPHPNDPALAGTHPRHKHMHPDIKHHRVPAPDLSFTRPNLPFLIEEVNQQVLQR